MSVIVQATSGTERAERMDRAPSTTPVLLRRLRAALVALALLAGGTALLLTIEAHAVTSSAGEHTASAVIQAYAAREALADADRQAVETIPLGAGPSGQYQDDIAAAEQGLEQVAENNTAGASGSQALQLIEGLLTSYTGLIEQADAHYRMQVNGESGVGVEDLWSASELMHGQILTGTDSLADLQSAEQNTLAEQCSSPWASPWLFAGWMIAALALLGTLVTAQRQFYLRLRRMLSKYLTLAAATLIGLCLVTGHVIAAERAFDSAQSGPLAAVVALQDAQTALTDQQGQTEIAKLVACPRCSAERDEADTLAKLDARALTGARPAVARAGCTMSGIPGCITDQQSTYDADAIAAEAGNTRSLMLIVALTALLVLLTFLGFRRHLDEYRYRWSA
jgi:hypothetical protein